MCLFRKKKKEEIPSNAKFKINENVSFKYRDDLIPGIVYKIYKSDEGILYDIQVGGECPYIRQGIKEKDVIKGVR